MAEEIRYVRISDVEPTNIFLVPVFALYRELMDYDYQFVSKNVTVSPDVREQLLTEAFLSIKTLVLAKAGDKLVGFVAISTKAVDHISEMFVTEEYRRLGIGRKLFTELKSMVKGPLRVNSLYGNEDSFKFYRSLGFAPITVGMTELS